MSACLAAGHEAAIRECAERGSDLHPDSVFALLREIDRLRAPIPMILTCPCCNARHIDEGRFATTPHHTHACQECGLPWRPAIVPTVGVRFLPGFKNEGPR